MRLGHLQHVGVGHAIVERLLGSGHDGHAGAHRRLPRRRLAAHQRDRLRRRPDERQSGIAACGGKVLVLGEKAVAGMDRVGARLAGGVDDRIDPQVALARRVRADRQRLIGHPHVQRATIAIGIHRDLAMPMSRQARMTRTAISPRFAMRIFFTGRTLQL